MAKAFWIEANDLVEQRAVSVPIIVCCDNPAARSLLSGEGCLQRGVNGAVRCARPAAVRLECRQADFLTNVIFAKDWVVARE